MAMRLFEKGREGLIDGTVDLDTNTIKAALLDLNTADVAVKAVTAATNATPIVLTATAHGFTNGDIIVVGGVGGNTAANNIWKASAVAANTITLVSVLDGTTNSVGNGAYTSGGYVVCLGPSASGDNWDDLDACLVGTAQTLTSPTVTNGTFDAADPTFTAVSGASVEAWALYKDTGTASTSRLVFFNDGKFQVTAAATAASSATTIAVEPLAAAIANGATIVFSNGASATLSSGAAQGARSLAVSALAAQVTAGSYATADVSGGGLPVTPNGGNITITFDNGTNRIFTV
jgi:hypothetical protein